LQGDEEERGQGGKGTRQKGKEGREGGRERAWRRGEKSERTTEEFLWKLNRFLQETNSKGIEFCRERIL